MLPDEYDWLFTQAAAVQPPPPPPVGGGDVGGGGGWVTGAFLANATVYAVKSHGFCATPLHSLDRLPLLSGGLHCRSRFTDQNVYLLIPLLCAKLSTVWKSLWVKYSAESVRPSIPEKPSCAYAIALLQPNVLISCPLNPWRAATCEEPPLNPPSNGMIV